MKNQQRKQEVVVHSKTKKWVSPLSLMVVELWPEDNLYPVDELEQTVNKLREPFDWWSLSWTCRRSRLAGVQASEKRACSWRQPEFKDFKGKWTIKIFNLWLIGSPSWGNDYLKTFDISCIMLVKCEPGTVQNRRFQGKKWLLLQWYSVNAPLICSQSGHWLCSLGNSAVICQLAWHRSTQSGGQSHLQVNPPGPSSGGLRLLQQELSCHTVLVQVSLRDYELGGSAATQRCRFSSVLQDSIGWSLLHRLWPAQRWRHSYLGYFGFICVHGKEVETRRPSLNTVIDLEGLMGKFVNLTIRRPPGNTAAMRPIITDVTVSR